ncbi:hypothetical protein C8J56DRAFT_883393 [Mycena floridula]|nr:hypothetical protein C8J56DRAFT_883393 [Mycena floridula]
MQLKTQRSLDSVNIAVSGHENLARDRDSGSGVGGPDTVKYSLKKLQFQATICAVKSCVRRGIPVMVKEEAGSLENNAVQGDRLDMESYSIPCEGSTGDILTIVGNRCSQLHFYAAKQELLEEIELMLTTTNERQLEQVLLNAMMHVQMRAGAKSTLGRGM